MKTILITGATGFIGHFLAYEFIKDHHVICISRPGSNNLIRLEEIKDSIEIVEHDINQSYDSIFDRLKDVNIILHAGGNPSSEASINDPVSVIKDNVIGTAHVLELARKLPIERVFYYSAGEIFGPIAEGTHSSEDDAYRSPSPYAASKAGGEEVCVAYANTFKIPISITHITNTFGQRSQCNRLPVIAIKKILAGETIDIHANGDTIGGRRWFHAADVALQTRFILDNQKNICEKWNSVGNKFVNNLDFVQMIADIIGLKLKYNLVSVPRLGQSPYYSMSLSKLQNAGWVEPKNLEDRLRETIKWYQNNQDWLNRK